MRLAILSNDIKYKYTLYIFKFDGLDALACELSALKNMTQQRSSVSVLKITKFQACQKALLISLVHQNWWWGGGIQF